MIFHKQLTGFILLAHVLTASASLTVFESEQYSGRQAVLEPQTIYRGEMIPEQLNKEISSLILKQGYQVVIGVEEDGVGLSKVLIANERDIRIPVLS